MGQKVPVYKIDLKFFEGQTFTPFPCGQTLHRTFALSILTIYLI